MSDKSERAVGSVLRDMYDAGVNKIFDFSRYGMFGKAEKELKQIILSDFVEKLKGELYVYNNHMPEVIDEEKIDRIYREFVGEDK